MSRLRLATVWLDGCSGCHMSFLDMDERLIELARGIELVYSPLVDAKEFPEQVDVTLVEGAVGTRDDEEKLRAIRARTRVLVALGDCAVTANVPAMRNPFGPQAAMARAYQENATRNPGAPTREIPVLQARVRPLHEVVPVDVFVPGCPPSADTIHYVLQELLAGRMPDLAGRSRFGA
ncbi:MAG: NADP oxidoreductase [Bryobacterales bacterium]|nr:NADP oxidoreductase [Bryobacteraceae bacterium]MDW8130548.1 NADP oxidoreductase [Bryobacterales bacterium]